MIKVIETNSMLPIYGKEGECDIKYEISHERK